MTDTTPINLVFMLEETSAKDFLEKLLLKIIPLSVTFKCISHQGKSDLRKSIPIKLKNWLTPNSYFVILHDQDSYNCVELKKQLRELCMALSQHTPLIRIACKELEAWYCGDLDAVQKAFPAFDANKYKGKARFKDPDDITEPSKALKKIVKGFDKRCAARTVPEHMSIRNNTSTSFNHFITGVKKLVRVAEGN